MIKLGYIKFTDGGIDMGVGAALVASAVIGAGATAYGAAQQSSALKKQEAAQRKAAEEQRKQQEVAAAQAAKEKAEAEAALKAQQNLLKAAQDAKRGGRGGLLFGNELGVTDESEQTTKTTLG